VSRVISGTTDVPAPYEPGERVMVLAFHGASKDEYEAGIYDRIPLPVKAVVDECEWYQEDNDWEVYVTVAGVPGFGVVWPADVRPLTVVELLAELA